MKKLIDIDAEFDNVFIDEASILKHTRYAKASLSRSVYRKQNPYTEEQKKQIGESNRKTKQANPLTAEQKKQINNHMRGKTLEEIIGVEAATRGRQARSNAFKGKKRPVEVGQKISATRKARGSYIDSGMTGHEHKSSTKEIMAVKAKIRQDLRRSLNLGKSGKLPKELLEAEYEKRGLK